MSAAKPIIIGIDGIARKLIEEAQAGEFSEPEDPERFAQAVIDIKNRPDLKALGERGLKYVEANFNRDRLADKYLDILCRLTRAQ